MSSDPLVSRAKVRFSAVLFLALFAVSFSVLVVVSLPSAHASYEENIHEGIFLVTPKNQYTTVRTVPTYLSTEDMTFFACIEYDSTPVRLSVLCSDNNDFVDVPAKRWGPDNCFIGSLNLEQLSCHDAVITADYVRNGENQRITKAVHINHVTGALQRLLDAQYTDGGWSSALDTAFALFSIKPFANVFTDRINEGMQYLKANRDESNKCWPQAQCQVSTTAMIAYLLTQASYPDDSRVLHDASLYLERTMSYISTGENYTVGITDHPSNANNSVNTSCVFAYDSANRTVVLPRYPLDRNYTITPHYGSVVNVVCTENILATITTTSRGRIIAYAGDNFTYVIPGPCWTYNNENVTCDLRATAFAAGSAIDTNRKAAAARYLATMFSTSVLGDELADHDVMTAAIIAGGADASGLGSTQRLRIIDNMLYRQSNDGFWNATHMHYNDSYYEPSVDYRINFTHVLEDNVTRNIVYTGFTVESLLANGFTRESEPVLDAERWLSDHETAVTVQLGEDAAQDADAVAAYNLNASDITGDPKRNAMALYVLQLDTRPFIKSDPSIIVLDRSSITIDLTNPTTFALKGLTYQLPDGLKPYMKIEEKDTLDPYSFRRITVKQTGNISAEAFGYLRIMSGSNEYAKIPVIITGAPLLNITFPPSLTVFGASTVVPLNVSKSTHNYTCTLQWKDGGITSISSFTLDKSGLFSLPVQFTQIGTEERTYSGTLSCTAITSTFTFPFSILFNRFLTRPIDVSPTLILINNTLPTGQITIKNLLDESIDVTLAFRDKTAALELSDDVLSLYPGETHNVTVSVIAPIGDNVSEVNSVIVKTFNIENRVPVTAEIIVTPKKSMPLWQTIAVSVFSVGVLGLLGYFAFTNRAKLKVWYSKQFKKDNYYADLKHSVEEYERKEATLAIKNMVAILKMQGLADKDIHSRLVAQGFSEEEISTSLKARVEGETARGPAGAQPPGAQGGAQRK